MLKHGAQDTFFTFLMSSKTFLECLKAVIQYLKTCFKISGVLRQQKTCIRNF